MSTKKTIFLILGLIVLAGIIFTAIKLRSSDKEVADYVVPELQLTNMHVTNLTANKAEMNLGMAIDNPSPVGIRIDSLQYVIYMDDNEVARTTYPDSLRIEASDSTAFSLPLTLYFDKLDSVLDSLEQQGQDSANYRVDATIYADMPVIPKGELDLNIEKRLPLIWPPEIQVADIGVEDVGLSGATLKADIVVTNKNDFDLGFRNMNYAVQLEDNEAVEGNKPGTVHIPADSSTTISIPAEIDFKGMGKNLIDLIRKGDDVRYNFDMNTEMVSDSELLDDGDIQMSSSGKLKSAIEAVESVSDED
jgi:LEA14-like dessication related protein